MDLDLDREQEAVAPANFAPWRERFLDQRLRLALITTLGLNPIFLLLDWLAYPQQFGRLLPFRIAISAGAAVVLALRLIPGIARQRSVLLMVTICCATVPVSAMTAILGGLGHYYTIGIIFLVFGIAIFVPCYWPAHLTAHLVTMSTHFAVNLTLTKSSLGSIATNAVFFVSTSFLSIVAIVLYERLQRRELSTRAALAASYARLQELDRTKDQFFANVSHELRTPLTIIRSGFDELARSVSGSAALAAVDAGRRSARRLLELINQLLDLSKIDAGKALLRLQTADLAQLLRDVVATFQGGLAGEDAAIVLDGCGGEVVAQVDARHLWTVVFNLLSNAAKFTSAERRRIRVSLKVTATEVTIAVSDNGIGIAEDQRERIFERFAQVDSGLARRYEGSGIGLSLVKEVVILHGGKIDVESVVGEGSCFTLTLPRGDISSGPTIAETDERLEEYRTARVAGGGTVQPAIESLDAEKENVLIVEDNTELRAHLARRISPLYNVRVARDGQEALELMASFSPQLVLSDLMMPGMDGIALIDALRERPGLQNTPVLMLTADGDEKVQLEALRRGACDFVTKPFSDQILLARIETHLRLARREVELSELNDALRRSSRELEELATTDFLTRLANRRTFDRELHKQFGLLQRLGVPMTVMLVDVDEFKPYNDTLGHQSGDLCLQAVARVLAHSARRSSDVVARYGGDEFAAVLGDTRGSGAETVARRIVDGVRELRLPHPASSVAEVVTVTVGLTTAIPGQDQQSETLVGVADQALYRAKQSGRNRWHYIDQVFPGRFPE